MSYSELGLREDSLSPGGDLNMGGMMQPSQQPPGYSGHPGYPRPGDMVPPHANQSFTQMRMPNQPSKCVAESYRVHRTIL